MISLPLLLAMPVLAFYAAERLYRVGRPAFAPALAVAASFAAGVVLAVIVPDGLFGSDAALAVVIGLFIAAVLLGVPIAFALLLAACTFFLAIGTVPMVALPQRMVDGTGNFILLAIPFFIFAGLLMERGGISLRLVALAQGLVGHLRGGMRQVAVVSMYLMSGLSGSIR